MKKIKTAILISGRGSNMKALIEASKDKNFPAEICLVISNKKDASGLEYAKKENIKTLVISHKEFKTREEFDDNLTKSIKENDCEIICLAGFMRILSDKFTKTWHNKALNIHPSLLPAFKGNDAVGDAIKMGAKFSGCTVHLLTSEMDSGPIIMQSRVEISSDDNKETLAAKILIKEHEIYPKCLRILCESIQNNKNLDQYLQLVNLA